MVRGSVGVSALSDLGSEGLMEDALSRVLVEPIGHVYALLWRYGILEVEPCTD